MSELMERRITEWATWYHANKKRIPPENLKKRCDFLELSIDGLLELLAIATKDIQNIEHRRGQKRLILPQGTTLTPDGKVARFF